MLCRAVGVTKCYETNSEAKVLYWAAHLCMPPAEGAACIQELDDFRCSEIVDMSSCKRLSTVGTSSVKI